MNIEARLAQVFSKERLMCTGAACSHHNAIEAFGFDHLAHIFQRVAGTGEGEMVGIDHGGQGAVICGQGLHIDDTGDRSAARHTLP